MHEEFSFAANSEQDTARIGSELAPLLRPNDVIALNGNLGAGKTRFVQAVASAMGVDQADVNSPTFVLIQEYSGRLNLYHFDTYRLSDSDEFLELGADEILDSGGVCLIEWADRVADVLPRDILRINIEHTGTNARRFEFHGNGPRSNALLRELKDVLVSDE